MNTADSLTAERVSELVLANRAIRAPYYEAAHDDVQFTEPEKGFQWGADAIPALLGLFRVERDPREDHPDGWLGYARHWRGSTVRLDFDLFGPSGESEPILVVTAVAGRASGGGVVDEELGEVDLPEAVPTEDDWTDRQKQYQAVRRRDDTDGAAAVEAYIAALPGWKRDVAAHFDEIIEREVPDVRRAVRYHQPFYGVEDEGWFAAFSALSKHVKLTFVCESDLDPRPPSGTGSTRQVLDVTEADSFDEEQVASWVRQAVDDPGMGW